jgi:integrase
VPYAPSNPAREVSFFKTGSTGYHTWTPEEVRQFEERPPVGSKARLALALLMFTGQRRADVTRFGRQHARGGKLTFIQHKGRNRNPKQLTLPILPALQKIIDASPCGDLTYLVNDYGRPFADGPCPSAWCN